MSRILPALRSCPPFHLAVPAAFLGLAAQVGAQTTVFSDDLSSDGFNPAVYGAPTSTSTSWSTIANGTTGLSTSLSEGALSMGVSVTRIVEAAALFTTAPLRLAATGDFVELNFTFSTANFVTSGSFLHFGLFNSGGSAPLQGLIDYTTSGGYAGGVANWTGYHGYIGGLGTASSKLYARGAQGLATNNQDLLASFSSSIGSYAGTTVLDSLSFNTTSALPDATYTLVYRVELDNSLMKFLAEIYTGTDLTATPLITNSFTQSAGTVTDQFDAVALGLYRKGGSPSSISVTDLSIIARAAPVPEPASFTALGGTVAMGSVLLRRRRPGL